MEKQHQQDIDISYEKWQELLGFIPDFDNQLRFLRQYYNAFKVDELIKHDKIARATKSNILQVYERLIKKNALFTFGELLQKGEYYGKLIGVVDSLDTEFTNRITELNRVGAAASYTLLLYLLANEKSLEKGTTISQIIEFVIKYYVRRNVTDIPNTRDLDAVTIEVVENCFKQISEGKTISLNFIIDAHIGNTKAKPAPLQDFKRWLSDKMYANNVGMTRYLLWKLDSINHTREYAPDLWQRNPNNETFVWTIEHVFPEGENIPKTWIDMIGAGDKDKAQEIQVEVVHLLGNLTLSAYNSSLSNRSFSNKQDLSTRKIEKQELKIGYKNGLSLNNLYFDLAGVKQSLSTIDNWTKDSIIARTEKMVEKLIEIFKFDYE